MGEASKQRDFPKSVDVPVEKKLPVTPPTPFPTINPNWRLSPRHNGSTLYDSFELQAVIHQLNKATHGSTRSSPTYLRFIKSPFYRQHLDSIYKENAKSPKKIGYYPVNCTTHDRKGRSRRDPRAGTGGLVTKLWKKIKQGLLWTKQRT